LVLFIIFNVHYSLLSATLHSSKESCPLLIEPHQTRECRFREITNSYLSFIDHLWANERILTNFFYLYGGERLIEMQRNRFRRRIVLTMAALWFLPLSVTADDQGQPATLEQCIQAALSAGPDLRSSQADLASSEAQYAEAVARNSIGLTTSAGASRNDISVDSRLVRPETTDRASSDTIQGNLSLAGPNTKVDLSSSYKLLETDPLGHSTNVALSASQTIWDGYARGRGYATVQQAKLSLQASRIADQDNRRAVASNVTKAYYSLLAAQRTEGLQEQTLSQRQDELERVQTLFDAQNASAIDLMQARVNLKSADIDLGAARENIISAREKLSRLIGWSIDKGYSITDVADLPLPVLDAGAAVARALEQRAELRQLRVTRVSGDIELAVKRAQRSPTVSAGGSVGWTHDWTDDTDYGTWSANLSVSVPVFDAGLAEAQIRQASMQNESSRIQEEQLVASISAEVRDAVSALRTVDGKAELARQSLELAEAQYELARLQLESGAGSPSDLLDASVTLSSARVALYQALAEVQLGILSLKDVMGE
jgi:outer membrane protein